MVGKWAKSEWPNHQTVWYILREKIMLVSSATQKGLDVQGRQVVDDHRILSIVKKIPFTASSQVKNTLQEVGIYHYPSLP